MVLEMIKANEKYEKLDVMVDSKIIIIIIQKIIIIIIFLKFISDIIKRVSDTEGVFLTDEDDDDEEGEEISESGTEELSETSITSKSGTESVSETDNKDSNVDETVVAPKKFF